MTEVSGPLTLVTEDAAVVTSVWVQAPALRPHGEGAILPQRARATITTGSEVAFSCAPGPAVLIWQAGGVEDQVPILVDDAPSQTLAEVVTAAQLAGGRTADELAALVAQVVSGVAAVTAAASSASWDGDRLTVMGATSPPLKGEKGDRGEKGEPGAAGDGTGDVLWSELTPVLDGKASVSHQHSMEDITGLEDELYDTVQWAYVNAAPTGNTIAYRASTGALAVGTATASNHAVTKAQLESSQPIIVSSMPSSPLPGRIYLVTGD